MTGGVVTAIVVGWVLVSIAVMVWWRRSRAGSVEVLLPTSDPLPLGSSVTARFRALSPADDTWQLRAVLTCTESVPTSEGATASVVALRLDCPHRVLRTDRGGEAEVDLVIPLTASPTMDVAGHRIDWELTVDLVTADGDIATARHRIDVAPAVAAHLLGAGELS